MMGDSSAPYTKGCILFGEITNAQRSRGKTKLGEGRVSGTRILAGRKKTQLR